jgi:ribose transport system substrate-binding protein
MKTRSVCFAAFALAFCAFAAAAEPLRIAVIPKAVGHEYWATVRAGALKAEAELTAVGTPVKVIWEGTAREDQVEEQKQLVARFITAKVGAIVLAPVHAQALVPVLEQAKAANIPVIVIDSPLGSDLPVSTVATNNYKAGLFAGRRLAEVLGGSGKVALFRYMKGHGSTQPRESGFLDAMKKHPGIQLVSTDVHAGATAEEQEKNARELLGRAGAELKGIFASNLDATLGMLAALRGTGAAGKVAFVGFDSNDALVDALRKGDMSGFAVQQPFEMGLRGVRTAVAAAQGKSVDKEVDTDVKIVTKENLDTPEVQRLLNPSGT